MASVDSWNKVGTALPERVGLLAAVGLSGWTFGRSLMPRTPLGQAIVTGLWGAASYALVTTCESAVIAAAHASQRHLDGHPELRELRGQAFGYAAHAVAAGTGYAIEKALPPRPHEKLWRSTARTSASFLQGAAGAGAVAIGVLDTISRTGRAPRADDVAATAYRANTPWYGQVGALAGVGAVASAATVFWQRRRGAALDRELGIPRTRRATSPGHATSPAHAPGIEPDAQPGQGEPTPESAVSSAALAVCAGAGTAAALVGFAKAEGLVARQVAHLARPMLGPYDEYAGLVGRAVTSAGIAAGIGAAFNRLYRSIDEAGDAVEAAYRTPPTSRTVSGGPASMVPWGTLAREGRRFVKMALTADEITNVTGQPAIAPVHAFVGLESAQTPLARAVLLLDEMERLGAFERSIICVASPTGSGYVNPVVAETLAYLTAGDCATAAIQYSLRPSFLSLDRVRIGRENNIAFLTLLARRLATIPAERRPRVVAVGESLGAHTLQDSALHHGPTGLESLGIDRALFIGTPAGSGWAKEWRAATDLVDPDGLITEVASITEWRALPDDVRERARYILLTHHEDPIGKFGPEIALRRPDWLDPALPRQQGVPPEMTWHPLLTGFLTLADVINAQDVTPGVFDAFGHDYRADLAEFTRQAFALVADDDMMVRIEAALRRREADWAARRIVSEYVGKAVDTVRHQLGPDAAGPILGGLERISEPAARATA